MMVNLWCFFFLLSTMTVINHTSHIINSLSNTRQTLNLWLLKKIKLIHLLLPNLKKKNKPN